MNRLFAYSGAGTPGTWKRWMPAWHLVFYSVLIVSTAFALADATQPIAQRLLCAGLSLLFAFWYAYMIIWHDRWWRQTRPMLIYAAGAMALTFILISLQPAYTAIGYTLCGQLFGMLPIGWAMVSVAVLLLSLLWREAALKGQSILAEPGLALSYLFVGVVATIFGLWVNAIIRESRSRQELIDRLEATQSDLATAERQAGILEERQRLAREIHDTLAQGLTSIVMHLEAAEGALAQDSVVAQQHLNQARQTARDSLTEARRFVWALRPESLERDPLSKAIMRVAERWSEEHHLSAQTHITGMLRSLPPEIEVTLLRAAQEALANAAKHAHANEVTLTLSYMNDVVALDIQDNGLGFDRSSLASAFDGDSFGLVAMRQRVAQWGGTLTIESTPQEGTTLAIEIPIDKESI
jgi:signal transduction histidine kinase